MPVNIIDTLKPKNSGSFPVVEASDVAVSADLRLPEALAAKADASALADTNATVNTKAAELQGEIDQIVISSTAEAVVAPEVAAARVDDDGVSHETLKARLDSDSSSFNDTVSNVVNVTKEFDDSFWISGSGAQYTSEGVGNSGVIHLLKGQKIRAYVKGYSTNVAFVSLVSNETYTPIIVSTNSDAKWIEYIAPNDIDVIISSYLSINPVVYAFFAADDILHYTENGFEDLYYKEINDFDRSFWISAAGNAESSLGFGNSGVIHMLKGQRLEAYVKGYGYNTALLASVSNGTYTPILISSGSDAKWIEYFAPDDLDVIVSSNVSISPQVKVRYDTKSIKEDINDLQADVLGYVNLFDRSNPNIISDHFIDTSGNITEYEGYRVSYPIAVKKGVRYKHPSDMITFPNDRFLYTTAEGEKVAVGYGAAETVGGTNYLTFTANRDGYVQLNIGRQSPDTFMFCEYAKFPTSYVSYGKLLSPEFVLNAKMTEQVVSLSGGSALYGKRVLFIGDSITEGIYYNGGWVSRIAERNGCECTNEGHGGWTIGKTPGSSNNLLRLLNGMSTDYDYVILSGGYNDFTTSPRAGFGEVTEYTYSQLDSGTFCGDVEEYIRTARTKWISSKIGFILTMKKEFTDTTVTARQKTYFDTIAEICQKYSIPILNLYNSSGLVGVAVTGVTDLVTSTYYHNSDGTHPNAAGYDYLVPQIENWIKKL